MFAPRFDPTALVGVNTPSVKDEILGSKKRKLSNASISEDEESSSSSSSDSDSSSSSDSESDSDSSSDSDSDSSSDSDSDSESGSESQSSRESGSDSDAAISSDTEEAAEELEETQNKAHLNNEQAENDKMDIVEDKGTPEVPVENDPDYISKHHSVFQKFKSIQDGKGEDVDEESDDNMEDIQTQDLAPLPQPALPRDKRLVSTSAHLNNLDWLTTPIYATPEETKPFADFNDPPLSPLMIKNLRNMGFESAFSVQISVLNLILKDIEKNRLQPDMRGDLLVNASTGSGKTLAYLIPIIESLQTVKVPRVRALILVPTKPLINQVKTTLNQLSKGTNLSIVSLKNDLSIKDEGMKLQANEPDIIVSTPGRLVDHLTNGYITLKNLQFLVIDEADRLLNQSFQNWCQILISKIDEFTNIKERTISNYWKLNVQKMIFSATLTTDAGKLSLLKFHKPRLIIVNNKEQLVNEMFSVPATLNEFRLHFGSAKSSLKPLILSKFLLSRNKLSNVLIFTKSNDASLRLSRLLSLIMNKLTSETINIAYINSTNNTTSIRSKILKDFSKQSVNILVATDLIARGIDILSITDVINYDLPNSSREYVHRVGRTARANQDGFAYNFCFGKGEAKWFKKLMAQVGRSQNIEDLEIDTKQLIEGNDESMYKESLEELQKQVFNRA
ncbi:uncharacterized protein AC631_03078 [Debaryomyces fabryi]|uniref:ATP-dependent RNA helicase n=1 Tax=Debaryomyces fabryi TaxID=58627 RepID=A0A0V1PY32_9ASCO|nr:uncharacterized protein AC631_03078 [Debaryomyces fabryi]KSA01137.1 hypothetical protein AC631_03078 [Debaryomyces fabryi]CUM46367.1 unnamed protein product [Debaryomyces fabryi]